MRHSILLSLLGHVVPVVALIVTTTFVELPTGFQPVGIYSARPSSSSIRADPPSTTCTVTNTRSIRHRLFSSSSDSQQYDEDDPDPDPDPDDKEEEDAGRIIIIDNVAEYCGVRSPTNYRSIPVVKRFARWTWRQRVAVLRVLHWNDPLTPEDSCINLECLWWKVLSTTDPSSPCYESLGYTYDLLPRPSRRLITSLRRWHPRWIHALLEVRMAYLNQAIAEERNQIIMQNATSAGAAGGTTSRRTRVRVVSLGAGYDIRSIRLLEEESSSIDECFEFDLPGTIESKRQIVQERLSKRQEKRRRRRTKKQGRDEAKYVNGTLHQQMHLPTMIGLDLNDTPEFQRQLQWIFSSSNSKKKNTDDEEEDWYTIFVVEGVLMYLDEGKGAAVLEACADAARNSGGSASLCFADRLFDRSDCEPAPMQQELAKTGWNLHEWAPSPNANAKHMGIARIVNY